MPKDLRAEARAEWRRIAPELETMGLLTRADRQVLIRYVNAWADYCEASEQLDRFGKVITSKDGRLVPNPFAQVRKDAEAVLSDLSGRLMLSPAARLRSAIPHRSEAPAEVVTFTEEQMAATLAGPDPRHLLRVV